MGKDVVNYVFCMWHFADDLEMSESESDHSEGNDDWEQQYGYKSN